MARIESIRKLIRVLALIAGATPARAQGGSDAPAPLFWPAAPNGMSLGGAIAVPIQARRAFVLTARAEANPVLAPVQVGAYRLGSTIAMPVGDASLWIRYRASVAPFEGTRATARPDSGLPAWRSPAMNRAALYELSLGASRRIGQVSFSLSAGGARGMLRGESLSSGRMVQDSIWTDTSGWVPYTREVGGGESISGIVPASWLTGELNASWMRERFGVGASVGGGMSRARAPRSAWGTVEMAARVQPSVWVVATTGVRPDESRLATSASAFATVGIRLTHTARVRAAPPRAPATPMRAFAITRRDAGFYRVSLFAPGANSVELSGDFTKWTPMALARAGDGMWSADIRVMPGAYRVNVRIDGGTWKAPPGTATIADDFGGSAGLVVVPDR